MSVNQGVNMSAIRTRYFVPRQAAVVERALDSAALPVERLSATPDGRIWQATMPAVRDADYLVEVLRDCDDGIEIIAWHVNRGEVQVTFGYVDNER